VGVDGHGRFGLDVRFELLETTEPCIVEKLRGKGGGGLRFVAWLQILLRNMELELELVEDELEDPLDPEVECVWRH
jgi:hypothetical protein